MKFIKTQVGALVNLDHFESIYVEERFDTDADTGLRLEPTKWCVYAKGNKYAICLGRYNSIERANEVISDCLGHIYRMPKE